MRSARSRTCRRGAVRSSSWSAVRTRLGGIRGRPSRAVRQRARRLGVPATRIPGRGKADAHGADGEHAHAHEEHELFVGHVRIASWHVVDWVARRGRVRPPLGCPMVPVAGGPGSPPEQPGPVSVATVQRTKRCGRRRTDRTPRSRTLDRSIIDAAPARRAATVHPDRRGPGRLGVHGPPAHRTAHRAGRAPGGRGHRPAAPGLRPDGHGRCPLRERPPAGRSRTRSRALPEVTYVVVTAGAYDLLVETVCRDNAELLSFLADRLRRIPGVVSTETFVYLRITKQIVPLEHPLSPTPVGLGDPRNRPVIVGSVVARGGAVPARVAGARAGRRCSPGSRAGRRSRSRPTAWTSERRRRVTGASRRSVLHGLALIGGVIGPGPDASCSGTRHSKPVFLVVLIVASVLWGAIAVWAILGRPERAPGSSTAGRAVAASGRARSGHGRPRTASRASPGRRDGRRPGTPWSRRRRARPPSSRSAAPCRSRPRGSRAIHGRR